MLGPTTIVPTEGNDQNIVSISLAKSIKFGGLTIRAL